MAQHLQFRRSVDLAEPCGGAALILNADDWGRDVQTTRRINECIAHGSISSISAMVFMADSESAAARARELGIDTGLHLNFTTPFSSPKCSSRLLDRQRETSAYLRWCRFSRVILHPGLLGSFEYVMAAQLDEFYRLYGMAPERLDGHHHMHLCANVAFANLLPVRTVVRRNFSFQPGEKSLWNRLYRGIQDRWLARRHYLVDFLFSLSPINDVDRLRRIVSLASMYFVEVETHPAQADEYKFLTEDRILHWATDFPIARRFEVSRQSDSFQKRTR